MADIKVKREDITLSDWTKGISADEFAWGSYYFSEWIQTWYSTKWFKLWPRVSVANLNERTQWYPLAVYPCMWSMYSSTRNFIAFTKDWYLEMWDTLNWSTKGVGWSAGGGAIWHLNNNSLHFTWGFVYGDYALAFLEASIRKIEYKNTYDIEYWQLITNPDFSDSALWWTVGAGWTATDDWMEHETWYSDTIVWGVHIDDQWLMRIAIKVTWCTTGTVNVYINTNWGTDVLTTEAWRNGWFVWTAYNGTTNNNATITITPSSDFNWWVEAINQHMWNENSWSYIWSLTSWDKHIAIERWGDIYIATGNTVDILSTIDWTISDSKTLCAENEEIIAMTQQADSLIIWSTNWMDSFQYYWNGVDSAATECIRWQGQIIQWVTGTETLSYVLAGTWEISAWNAYRLYSVSGYQRSLIASNAYGVEASSWNLEHYHPSKKFVFNDVRWPESMCICLDNLYIPGCDGIYQFGQTLPWLSKAWSRPIKYPNWVDRLMLFPDGWLPTFTYRLNQRQYYGTIGTDTYNDKWYLVTDSIYWDKLGTRKAIEKLKLGYKSISSRYGSINIYAIVDDDYFWRFDVTGVTTRPKVWDVYEVANHTTAEIIRIDKNATGKGTITLRTIHNEWSLTKAKRYLTKVSWDGDASLDSNNNYDNMCLIKTIETEQQEYGSDLIFWKDFVNNYMPYRHKLQLVIEINKITSWPWDRTWYYYITPEIYELSMVSDITDVTL